MKKVLLLFALLPLLVSGQNLSEMWLVPKTSKFFRVSYQNYLSVTTELKGSDTIKLYYEAKKPTGRIIKSLTTALPAELKKQITGTGTATSPFKIPFNLFHGINHVNKDLDFGFGFDLRAPGDTTGIVLVHFGQPTQEQQREADSIGELFMERGRAYGYQPTGKIRYERDSAFIFVDGIYQEDIVQAPFQATYKGYLFPPASGSYTFAIQADDEAYVYLSNDESPEKKILICFNTYYTKPGDFWKYPNQKSFPIELDPLKKYYIEVIHKDGGGGGSISLGWELPGGDWQDRIPAKYFSPWRSK